MPAIRTVPLKGLIPAGGPIEFLRAEMARRSGRSASFALVRYAREGIEQPLGIRIDLDKGALLDQFDDPRENGVLVRAAPRILDLVSRSIRLDANRVKVRVRRRDPTQS